MEDKIHTQRGKSRHRPELIDHSDYDIVMTYNLEFQGLVNYYTVAQDVSRKLYPVKWVYVQSLVKTLAAKHKRGVPWAYRKYYRKSPHGVMCIEVKVPREGRKPLIARFGAKPIRFDKWATGKDAKVQLMTKRSQLLDRLLSDKCELCGSAEEIEVHHIHKLKDLRHRYRRQASPPEWVVKMAALRRKTLVVCTQCHRAIHAGSYDGPRLM
jgi:hypothetical protein